MRVRMVIAYDGAPYHGFAVNPGVVTVAGTLIEALSRVLRIPIDLVGAGRTDAGVHAWGQVVSFDAPEGSDLVRLARSVNAICAPSMAVRSVVEAAPDFDARFSAKSRVYRYRVLNDPAPNPFLAATTWHIPGALSLAAMHNATIPFIGEHDFSSFCRRPDPDASLVRRVLRAEWRDLGEGLHQFEVEARSFCHNMVRAITGTLVDIGLGRRTAAEVVTMLSARDRSVAGRVAPPHGLTLWEVRY